MTTNDYFMKGFFDGLKTAGKFGSFGTVKKVVKSTNNMLISKKPVL